MLGRYNRTLVTGSPPSWEQSMQYLPNISLTICWSRFSTFSVWSGPAILLVVLSIAIFCLRISGVLGIVPLIKYSYLVAQPLSGAFGSELGKASPLNWQIWAPIMPGGCFGQRSGWEERISAMILFQMGAAPVTPEVK